MDMDVLEELQPHPNLERLRIKNYCGAGFPNWMHSLHNLVRLELSNFQTGRLHLDHLQNLEDLCISSFYESYHGYPIPMHVNSEYGMSPKYIVSTQALKNLRKVTVAGVGNLVWETSTSSHYIARKDEKNESGTAPESFLNSTVRESSSWSTENIFPGLEHLEIDCCLDLRFEPSIPRSARYIISGSNKYPPVLFKWPSFRLVMGLSTSASSSKMEIRNSQDISSGPLDCLGQLDIEELTVDSCIDSIPLPECIWDWKSLRKIEILNCENIKELPEWLGDMASLRELKVETYWMRDLSPCIERLTSLQTLALLKCTKRFKQRCSEGGDDWSMIKHIDNLIVEERKP
jgi:hypothetical protein